MTVFFNGRLFTSPAVATKIDDTAMANKGLTVPMTLALIGRANSGEPQTAHSIANPAQARELFQSGELLKAIELAFAPSPETYGPQEIIALRVEPATQSRLVFTQDGGSPTTGTCQALVVDDDNDHIKLAAAASGTDDIYNGYYIKMTSGVAMGETNLIVDYNGTSKEAELYFSWANKPSSGDTYTMEPASMALISQDYGLNANRVKVKVETGTLTGSKKVTQTLGDDAVAQDNLAADYFTIQYTGADASALMTVTGTTITVSTGALAAEVLRYTCDLTTYDTVEKVVDFFDAKADMTATAGAAYKEKSTEYTLDYVADVAIKASAYSVSADLQAIVDALNSSGSPYVTAIRPNEAGTRPANASYDFLMGGTATAPSTDDWTACFTALQNEDVQCVVPLTSSASIHAAGDTHCEFMSTNGSERRQIVGGALDETTVATVTARALALNSDRTYLAAPGIKHYNDDGDLTTYAPYFTAAMLGGMICGSDPGTSLTNKALSVAGLEVEWRNPVETDELITGGVTAVARPKRGGYKVVKSVSTWLSNSNYNRVEMGTGFAVDYIARTVREALEPLVGKGAKPSLLSLVISTTENALIELARPAPMGPEVIVGDADNPAYKSITAELDGDVVRVYFTCSPVVPVNFIPVAISVVPYSGASASLS